MAKIVTFTDNLGNINGDCFIELETDNRETLFIELSGNKISVHGACMLPVISDYQNKVVMEIKSAIPGAAPRERKLYGLKPRTRL